MTVAARKKNGTWGPGALDNDGAADWMGETLDAMKISKRIRKGLNSKYPADVRAAAFLLQQTAYVYMYPIDHMDADLKAAIEALRVLLEGQWMEGWREEAVVAARADIEAQVLVLEARLQDPSAPGSVGLLEAMARQRNPARRPNQLRRRLTRS